MRSVISSTAFKNWLAEAVHSDEYILARSNQGTLLHYRGDEQELVVKMAMGSGPVRYAREHTLRREYSAYQRMQGLGGIPKCYGFIDGHYLVLEYVRGTPYRQASWNDRAAWFAHLLEILQAFHARGVSHGDLKSKSNILVTEDEQPCVIDFGTTVLQKPGFRPLNRRLFEYGKRLDLNAWVKHKYHGRYDKADASDQQYLNYSWLEKVLRKFRPPD